MTAGSSKSYDLVVIGTGMGGGTLAAALGDTGLRILLLERGDFLPCEEENWRPDAVFLERRYRTREFWLDEDGRPFVPALHPWVGGNTKVYGAALVRMRREDFHPREHIDGVTPGWPIAYEDLEPHYCLAEHLYLVHGESGTDPTEPPRSRPYPYPPVPHEPYVAELAERLRAAGARPSPLPLGVDVRPHGRCIRCRTCDGFPCRVLAKADADVRGVRPALGFPTVELMTRAFARRLLTDASGRRIRAVEVETGGKVREIAAEEFVVAGGAVHTAALLLRSANDRHPRGLANGADVVGRHLMAHHHTLLMAIDRERPNPTTFQKTLAVFDFYHGTPDVPFPAGSLQLIGKRTAETVRLAFPELTAEEAHELAAHSVDWWLLTEDLPDPENRVTLTSDGAIQVRWRPANRRAHEALRRAAEELLSSCGYREFLVQPIGLDGIAHYCGTVRFGDDPATSALDPVCRAWEVENLWVVDGSVFPTSGAVNPALTIAALALRTAEELRRRFGIQRSIHETIERLVNGIERD
ncbi:MAG: GMC family oxidoreductase [Thermomicrobium sp.]|nr:GMC family oxidoreductase [Thermomicrobium sp.]MDW8059414.1 GMC family oxidoreductase [Thermomicrobium sp.]